MTKVIRIVWPKRNNSNVFSVTGQITCIIFSWIDSSQLVIFDSLAEWEKSKVMGVVDRLSVVNRDGIELASDVS